MDYEEMLNKAMEKIPKESGTGERFEMPEVAISIQGKFTIVKNFIDIADKLRRDPKHLLKYLSKELAVPGNIDGRTAIFQGILMKSAMQKKLEKYVKEYVICKECTRPDTKLVKEDRITLMICEACGAKTTVKAI